MGEGSLGGVTVIAAAGAAGMLVALLFGAIQLGRLRFRPHLPRRRHRRSSALTPSHAGDRLALDVEGVVELVRTDRLRASARAEIEALTLAETLLTHAVSRYRVSAAPVPASSASDVRRASAGALADGAPATN